VVGDLHVAAQHGRRELGDVGGDLVDTDLVAATPLQGGVGVERRGPRGGGVGVPLQVGGERGGIAGGLVARAGHLRRGPRLGGGCRLQQRRDERVLARGVRRLQEHRLRLRGSGGEHGGPEEAGHHAEGDEDGEERAISSRRLCQC
jgi:hypothetical protein